ncbi:MAG TPA: PAS domain S-box protein, partial [Polyangia bacterium]|nr:PAS domain S-box protein [Polyangia bacterium]
MNRPTEPEGATESDLLRVMGEAIMSLGSDAVLVVDPETMRVVQANRAFSRILGYASDEIAGRPVYDFVAVDRRNVDAQVGRLIEAGRLTAVRPLKRKDGNICEMEMSTETIVVGGRRLLCTVARDLTEQREAQRILRESETRLRTFADAAFEGLAMTDNGRIIDLNACMAEMLRAPAEQLIGRPVMDFIAPESRDAVAAHLASGVQQFYEHLCMRADGSVFPVEVKARTIEVGGRILRMTAVRDVSERKSLEEQVRVAQRMESVGRLAGGVAHDFNNLLTVILSLVSVLGDSMRSETDLEDLDQIKTAAERAAQLTQQLLAFARRQIVEPIVLDLNDLVQNIDKMLRRLIGENVRLVTVPTPDLARIRADPGKIEQVLVNLAVNARDAMESGGNLTIETANVELGEDYAATHPEVAPGRYVMMSVSDTGVGMDAATISHIFEPFFTTKSAAKGTGLGLATCYGIVKQSGGSIWVYSEPGRGTTFKVYFPAVTET